MHQNQEKLKLQYVKLYPKSSKAGKSWQHTFSSLRGPLGTLWFVKLAPSLFVNTAVHFLNEVASATSFIYNLLIFTLFIFTVDSFVEQCKETAMKITRWLSALRPHFCGIPMLKLFDDSTRVNSKFGLKDDPADQPSTYRRYRLPFRRGNRQWIH